MKHLITPYRFLLAVLLCTFLTALLPPGLRAQNSRCSVDSLVWAPGDTSPKSFTISSRDSATFVVNASACSHFYVYPDTQFYTVQVTPYGANTSQTDIVQFLSVTIDDDGIPVTETVKLRHRAAPAPDPDPDPDPDPEPDPWAGIAADLPDTLSWIQRATVTAADGSSFIRDVTFYDGLGYPGEEVLVGASHGGTKSIYTPIVYDCMRRADARTYLPYAVPTPAGVFDNASLTNQNTFYKPHPAQDERPFAERLYETSPVGRPLSVQREGNAWDEGEGHRATFSYRTNTAADAVPRYRILPGTGVASYVGSWPAETLLCTQTTDEEGSVSRSFADAFGKVVLSEAETGVTLPGGGKETARTLYVYDLRDSLAVVVQPEGMKALQEIPSNASRDLSLDAGAGTNHDITDRYCFVWTYDGRGNVLSEHTPGGGTTQYVYDARNRMILRTDGRMDDGSGIPGRRRMVMTRHDMNDRIEEECYVSSPDSTVDGLRKLFRDTVLHTMSQQSIAQTLNPVRTLRTAAYFPFGTINYASSGDGAFVPETGVVSSSDLETTRIKGMLRQETVYPAPDVDGTVRSDAPSVTRYYHYDSKGRVIQLGEVWSDDRTRRVSTKYAFTGDVLATKETVIIPEPGQDRVNSLTTVYTRDPRGRVLSCSRVLDDTDTLATVHYAYDDLGRLVSKTIGDGNSPALETSLAYDLHGWTTAIDIAMDGGNGSPVPVFGEAVRYASPDKDLLAGRYDGNISETAFSHRITPSSGSPYLQTHTWSYAYDGLKRLTDANHYVGAQLSASLTDTEKSLGYDLNGNIIALKRYGSSGLENDLTFSHTGNRMTALVDANATGNEAGTKSFTYDANGNMTADGRKGLELSWNLLNLADSAAMYGGSLTYAWLSDGTKVSAKADDGSGNGVAKRYLGSFVYTTSGGYSIDVPTDVESVAWDEGRIFFDIPEAVPEEYIEDPDPEIDPYEPEEIVGWLPYRDCWFAGDHLGNVRSVIDITPDLASPEVLEQSDYLPFGTKISNPNLISGMNNRWRYAGKEEQRFGPAGAFSPAANAPFSGSGSLDLSLIDFGARMYDPFVARWTAVDPLAKKYPNYSTHTYCGDNPINTIDAYGDSLAVLNLGGAIGHSALLIQNESGKWEYYSMNGDNYYRLTKGRIGGKDYHDIGEKTFDSVESFLLSSYNQEGTIEQVETNEVNNYDFSEAYVVPTTPEQDRQAETTFKSETGKAYSFLFHNCSIVTGKALLSSGIKTGPSNIKPQWLFDSVINNNVGTYIIRKQ